MNMTKERWLLAGIYAVTLTALLLVPKSRRREAQAIYLFKGLMTWVLGLWVVELGWLSYPTREFEIGTRTSFAFEYLIYPGICIFFNLYFPQGKSWLLRALYYCAYSAGITIPEYFIEVHTSLVEYAQWKWYWTFISICMTLWLSRRFFEWFFQIKKKGSPARQS